MLYTAIVSTNRVLLMDCYVMLEWPMCLAQATKAATSVASLTQKRRVSKWRFTNYNHGTNCDGQRVNVLRILSGGIKTNHPQILPYLHVSIAAYIQHQSLVQSHHMSDKRVYGHLGPKTFRHYVFGAVVFHIFALAPVPKCLGQFGTKVHETLRTQN